MFWVDSWRLLTPSSLHPTCLPSRASCKCLSLRKSLEFLKFLRAVSTFPYFSITHIKGGSNNAKAFLEFWRHITCLKDCSSWVFNVMAMAVVPNIILCGDSFRSHHFRILKQPGFHGPPVTVLLIVCCIGIFVTRPWCQLLQHRLAERLSSRWDEPEVLIFGEAL